MRDPFRIDGPAIVSFSGGRTSGYMVWRILQAHGGALPRDVIVTFANTGKEHPLTLEFVHEVETRWGVDVAWLEWQAAEATKDRWKRVTYETAARAGEPFEAMIKFRGYTPNIMARICTTNLKIKTIEQFALAQGWAAWDNPIGLRADEPRRVSRVLARNGSDRWTTMCPLAAAGIDRPAILSWWAAHDFNLRLGIGSDGMTPEGNCDLCFLKGPRKIMSLIRAKPDSADWWARMETETGKVFRNDRPTYTAMKRMALSHDDLFRDAEGDDQIDCLCTE